MSQYTTGTANVTNASDTVDIPGAALLTNAKVGNTFKRKDEYAEYNIIAVNTDEQIRISPAYAGVTATGVLYQITKDFTPNLGLTEMNMGDVDWPHHLTIGVIRKLDTLLANITGASYRKLPRYYMGMPVLDREFGTITLPSNCDMVEVTMSAEASPDVTVGIDLAINGTYQSIGLNLTAGQYSASVTIAKSAVVNDVLKFKWTAVPAGFPGQNYTIDVKYKDTSVLEKRYEFMRIRPGLGAVGQRIGRGFKPAVKSRFFAGMLTAQGAPLGADYKVALMFNDVQQAQVLTLAAGAYSQYTTFTQLDVLTTETIDAIVTQAGSTYPGDHITLTLYSYLVA